MLVLLIIFMVITPMLQKGVSVDLAQVNNPEQHAGRRKGRRDGGFGHARRNGLLQQATRLPVDQLTQKVKDRLANQQDKRVYVKADARAKFGAVVGVVDNVRSAGVDQLGLLTDQKEDRSRAPPPPPRRAIV